MTQMQLEFAKLQETKRSNLAQEQIIPAKIQNLMQQSDLYRSQVAVNVKQLDKMEAEIQKIYADAELSKAQRAEKINNIVDSWWDNTIGAAFEGLVRIGSSAVGGVAGAAVKGLIG